MAEVDDGAAVGLAQLQDELSGVSPDLSRFRGFFQDSGVPPAHRAQIWQILLDADVNAVQKWNSEAELTAYRDAPEIRKECDKLFVSDPKLAALAAAVVCHYVAVRRLPAHPVLCRVVVPLVQVFCEDVELPSALLLYCMLDRVLAKASPLLLQPNHASEAVVFRLLLRYHDPALALHFDQCKADLTPFFANTGNTCNFREALLKSKQPPDLTQFLITTPPQLRALEVAALRYMHNTPDSFHVRLSAVERGEVDPSRVRALEGMLCLPLLLDEVIQQAYIDSKIVVLADRRTNSLQMMLRGDLALVFAVCSLAFDGTGLRALTQSYAAELLERESSWAAAGLSSSAFAYAPLEASSPWYKRWIARSAQTEFVTAEDFALDFGCVFVGMAAGCRLPHPEMTSIIEKLRKAGIRFVLFSERSDRQARVFGSKLGLETDWNSCIHLRDVGMDDPGDERDIKARLPRGIAAIRTHIAEVDNVPLLVQLFCAATPYTVREMIRIYQEYGEVVCCLASSTSAVHVGAFIQSNISLAIEPPARQCALLPQPEFCASDNGEVACASFPAALVLARNSSLSGILALLQAGRRAFQNLSRAFRFAMFAHMLLGCAVFLAYIALGAPILSGLQILFFVCVHIPLLTCSFLTLPAPRAQMSEMPMKQKPSRRRYWMELALTVLPTAATLVLFFNTLLSAVLSVPPYELLYAAVFSGARSASVAADLVLAQHATMWALLSFLLAASIGYLHGTAGLLRFHPFFSSAFLPAVILCIIGQLLFSVVSLLATSLAAAIPHFLGLVAPTHWYSYATLYPCYVLMLLWPMWIVGLEQWLKRSNRRKWEKLQKRAKLEFNTKLGMYSPV